jgi:hypothetical protein
VFVLAVSCAPKTVPPAADSLYAKELSGHSWRLRTGQGDIVFKFESAHVILDTDRAAVRFSVVASDDARKLLVLRYAGRYVPVWWRLGDDGILRLNEVDGRSQRSTLKEALASPAPSDWLGLQPE